MSYEEVFTKVKEIFMKADVSRVEEHLAFQFNITGEGEGVFYAEVKVASGKLDPVFAFTTGKLKVEGSLEKALMLQMFV